METKKFSIALFNSASRTQEIDPRYSFESKEEADAWVESVNKMIFEAAINLKLIATTWYVVI